MHGYNKLIIVLFSASLLLQFLPVHAQIPKINIQECSNTGNYTSNTQFQTNLNLLFRSLLSNGTRNGYFQDSVGSSPDTVYGLVQCRGDVSTQDCTTCLNTTSVEILQRCPYQKSASLRLEYCILHYSNTQFSGEPEGFTTLFSSAKVSDADVNRFEQQLRSLLNNLSTTAAPKPSRYNSGSIDYKPFNDIYGLVQCTPDLSPTNCLDCLQNMFSWIPSCCNRSLGARIYGPSCYVRYELYSFVQIQSQSPPPPEQVNAPPPSWSMNQTEGEDGNGKGKSTNVVAVVVPAVGSFVFFLAICAIIMIGRERKKSNKRKPELNWYTC